MMAESDNKSGEVREAMHHLEQAIEVEEVDEIDYHIRQALQLLGVE